MLADENNRAPSLAGRADGVPLVDRPVDDEPGALRAAAAVARRHGWDEPLPLRTGMNAIFAAGDDVVLRVGYTTAPPRAASELATLLAANGVRVPRTVAEPEVVDGFSVFALERVVASGEIDWGRVGEMVARVHRLDPRVVSAIHPLPWAASFPWWDFDALWDGVAGHLDAKARGGIRTTIDAGVPLVRAARRGPAVVLHGDLHPGNVIPTERGPVLIDWDLTCHGPAAWDHAPLMRQAERWGERSGLYEEFAAGYGATMRHDPLAEALAELRLVAATLMCAARAGRDPRAEPEAHRRLGYWRGDTDAPVWTAQ